MTDRLTAREMAVWLAREWPAGRGASWRVKPKLEDRRWRQRVAARQAAGIQTSPASSAPAARTPQSKEVKKPMAKNEFETPLVSDLSGGEQSSGAVPGTVAPAPSDKAPVPVKDYCAEK